MLYVLADRVSALEECSLFPCLILLTCYLRSPGAAGMHLLQRGVSVEAASPVRLHQPTLGQEQGRSGRGRDSCGRRRA